jgi:hypothetical protein
MMDLPSDYDEMGNPKDEELAEKFRDRKKYIKAVKQEKKRDLVWTIGSCCQMFSAIQSGGQWYLL